MPPGEDRRVDSPLPLQSQLCLLETPSNLVICDNRSILAAHCRAVSATADLHCSPGLQSGGYGCVVATAVNYHRLELTLRFFAAFVRCRSRQSADYQFSLFRVRSAPLFS
jgi:hypothetical protein